jgi:RNA polymerase sigma-70 factor (ECF subfamily)
MRRPRVDSPGVTGEEASTAADDMKALVDAAREGDPHALDDLVRVTYGGTYTLAYRLTGNDDDARDVVQDAYLRAYRGLRRFRGDAQFTTWLYRITANCSANLLAKRARHRTETLADDEQVIDLRPEVDPERQLAGSDERARIASALAQLPWRLRQVIVLRDIYDLAHGSIAKELGITEAAAKVRLHRARRRLRDLLSAEGTDAGAGYAVGGRGTGSLSDAAEPAESSGSSGPSRSSRPSRPSDPSGRSGADMESLPDANAG